ncbi:MAG: small basic protein [Candidatus Omnitrophota bacterium]|nr:MAG: small basic protein [Candidatus Omnitrophota bacterium]
MGMHPTLKISDKDKKQRSVLKRRERLKTMFDKEKWKPGDSVCGLPKIKTVRLKIKKEKAEKPEEAAAAEAAAAGATAQEEQEKEQSKAQAKAPAKEQEKK